MLTINHEAEASLQVQVFDQIRDLILCGRLRAGMALPSSRALANQLGVSRNTIMFAYERLAAEGYTASRGTAGMFVTSIPPDDLLLVRNLKDELVPTDDIENQSSDPLLCFAGSPGGEVNRPAFDFWVGRSAAGAFPLKTWRRIVGGILSASDGPRYLTDYCDPAGLPELRKAISDRLARSRGMDVSTDQIIVTTGGQDALNLILRVLRNHTRRLCIENPCYIGASLLFQQEELPIEPIPVDDEGIRVDLLPNKRRNLLFVTPSHQFPTGVMMSLSRRLALLKWAEETESFIIEDDYDSEFRYNGPPLTALSGLDRGRRVFYVGSFSKSVGAGVRLGFTVLPRSFWNDARVSKAHMSNGQSWLEQKALAEFINEGHFDRHVRKLSQIYKARRDVLIEALKGHFGDPKITGQDSGLHFVWHLPEGIGSGQIIQEKARSIGIGIYSLASGAAFDFSGEPPGNMVMLGYSSLTESEICQAIARLSDLLRDQGILSLEK
ncbi:PLP-dependent aminotransferase family protein [Cognatishimia maritima]|uniref:GntR family transcriptional regulator / MocR family aminotransferase n=1 Tax=Cognatishimia maritima TaxID=870908 RepID=A0A1M5Q9U8_9RHOB|nr:PLP-dependent aminotransferase family protein [Cognatishimia maritima]SHH10561.1 GntR family transcriptional regulator / MocR family aminotransferase [Cognatishimia maritima]